MMRLITALVCITLTGCAAAPQAVESTPSDPVLTADIAVSSEDLHHYWQVITAPYPAFPYNARSIEKATCVNIAFVIGTDGLAHNPVVIKTPPNTSKRFQKSALKAIKKFRYQPSSSNDARKKVITHIIFSFYHPLDDHSNKKTQSIVSEISQQCQVEVAHIKASDH